MRTLIIDNESEYLNKISGHVGAAAKEDGTENEVVRLNVKELQKAYNKGDAGVVKGFGYVISSGSGKYRKIDKELHKFVADNVDEDATVLGVCHGAQQYAEAHGSNLVKNKYMHRGRRDSRIVGDSSVIEGIADNGKMTNYGHHKWYIPVDQVGSELEVIAESKSKHTGEKFVEMFKRKGKEHYGVQFHPEKGDGSVIKNLFRKAAKKKGITGSYEGKPQEYSKAA